MQGTTQHSTCQRGVRQGWIEEPILFNLYPQKVLKEVTPHGDNHGVSLTNVHTKEQCTLGHVEYAYDLVLAANPPVTEQEMQTRLVMTLRKYSMKIAMCYGWSKTIRSTQYRQMNGRRDAVEIFGTVEAAEKWIKTYRQRSI